MALQPAPTFKLVDSVWHLIKFSELKKGDVFKSFNDSSEWVKRHAPVDFASLPSTVCLNDAFVDEHGTWGVMCNPLSTASHQ